MDIVHDRAVGIDISKRDAKVCVLVPGNKPGQFTSTVTTWGATTPQILELREFLEHEQVTTVVMEATSDYWDSQKLHQMGEPNASLRQLGG